MFRRQILGRKDSFGKIYDVTRQLDDMQPEKLYYKTVQIMEDVLQNKVSRSTIWTTTATLLG